MLERNKSMGRGFHLRFPNSRRSLMPRKTVLALALAMLLTPALLLADPGNGSRNGPSPDQILHNPRLLARYLHLTPEQATQAKALFATLAAALKGVHDQEKPLQDQLEGLLAGSNPSACDVGAIVVEIDGLRDQARAALGTFDDAFSAILTPEQLARYEALKEAAHLADGEPDA